MTTALPFPLVLLAAAVPFVALGQKIDVEYDHGSDFLHYRTFAIRQGEINSRNPALNSDLVRRNIEDSIRKHLTSRGLAETAGAADLNVRFSLGSVNRRDVEIYPAGWRWGAHRVVAPYTEGTLVIDLRDAHRRQLVWRGIAVEDKPNPAKIERHLDDMVRKTIGKYPPKKY